MKQIFEQKNPGAYYQCSALNVGIVVFFRIFYVIFFKETIV